MIAAAHRPGLVVLMYHGIVTRPLAVADWCFLAVEEFKRQMEFLAENARVVPLSQAGMELDRTEGAPAVALTFDDGLRCMHEVVFPILRDLGLPATVFLATDLVGTDRRLWFCDVNRALASTRLGSVTWRGKLYDLSSPASRARANSHMQAVLKEHPHPVLLQELEELTITLGVSEPSSMADDRFFDVLGEREIAEMVASPMIELGAHTGSHSILGLLDADEGREEIRRSVTRTAELAGTPCKLFAYPNGRSCDYTTGSVGQLKELGIDVAVTTNEGPNYRGQPLLELNRFGIGPEVDFESFRTLLEPAVNHG